jgi:hypothetical protein
MNGEPVNPATSGTELIVTRATYPFTLCTMPFARSPASISPK